MTDSGWETSIECSHVFFIKDRNFRSAGEVISNHWRFKSCRNNNWDKSPEKILPKILLDAIIWLFGYSHRRKIEYC